MTNLELQQFLKQYPDDMPIKIIHDRDNWELKPSDFEEENILHTSKTAYVTDSAPEEEWDAEEGKVMLGDGEQYLLINPIIV